jgi:serine/threonine-protein kinase HipA
MAFAHAQIVEVRAFGHLVGAVAPSRSGAFAFEYDPAWVRTGVEIAPILMPTSSRTRNHVFAGLPEQTFHRLPPMIADSLPDKFGNAIVDAWLATQGVTPSEVTALDRLTYLGNRGLGALEYRPANSPDSPPAGALDLAALVSAARDVVKGKLTTDKLSEQALRQIISVGTSAGGARAKAVVNYNPDSGDVLAGHTTPPVGFSAWLLKFDGMGEDRELGDTQNYGRIEYAYSLMAVAAGITMSETRLLQENGRAHFLTRRFDRPDGMQKLHSQTLTGIAAIDFNAIGVNEYAQLFNTIDELHLGEQDREEAFRRMVFNFAAANCDDHAKNHGFLMDETGTWSLAPAYDITHAHNTASQWTRQHLMAIDGKFGDVTRDNLLVFAERHSVPRAKAIIAQVNDAVDDWSEFAGDAGLSATQLQRIGADHKRH